MSIFTANRPSLPGMYERELVGPLFRPWAELMLDRADLQPGDRLLDVACGTGIVARLAKQRHGDQIRVMGVDASPRMLAVAQAVAPDIEWREGKAESLPVDGDHFQVVTCQQGLQFFAGKLAALRDIRRVLAPRGRVLLATWRPIEELPVLHDLQIVAENHLGPVDDQRHSFGDSKAITQMLSDAGFQSIRIEVLSRTIRFADPAMFVRMNAGALVGMSPTGRRLTREARSSMVAAIVQDSRPVVDAWSDGEGMAFEIRSNLATASHSPEPDANPGQRRSRITGT